MENLPTGTVTFLFTDVEGSTRLWEEHPTAMRAAAARHDAIIESLVPGHRGVLVRPRGEGDSRFAVFARASDAVAAAAALQQALTAEPWPTPVPVRVRIALHTGEAELRDRDYYGRVVNRCARLRAIAHGGQVLLSQTTHDLMRAAPPEGTILRDLGEHHLPDLAAAEHVYQLVAPETPSDFPPLRSLDAVPNNLPRQLTSFVGRERELVEVKRLLAASPLVTLTGTGGCGKTRLALQVGADLAGAFADGVWFVDLAPLADAPLVPQAVATALGVHEVPGRPILTTLGEYLRRRDLLLLVDNCEHLLDACAHLAETLLRACPHLRILATSRELLGLAGETAWRVPSLGVLDPRQLPALATLARYEAVQLFLDRARAVLPGFALTPENAPAVAQICERLDGIPLAIELAAARVRVLTVEQIAARLDERFRLLTGGSRTALRRQQTLQGAVDWSYQLLSEADRGLLRRLAVFAGGWALEAAEAVGAGGDIAGSEVLDLLSALVDKSLVLAEGQGAQERYRLLETIRQYAGGKLLEAGEAAMARDRHRDWFLGLALEAEKHYWGPDQGRWYDRLELDQDNLRSAIEWCISQGNTAAGLEFFWGLCAFWNLRGYHQEGSSFAERLLAMPGAEARTRGRSSALFWLAFLRSDPDFARVRRLGHDAIALAREVGEVRWSACIALFLADRETVEGQFPRADELIQESLATAQGSGDAWLEGQALERLGRLARRQGQYDEAFAVFRSALARCQAADDARATGSAYGDLGMAAMDRGDLALADECLRRGLDVARDLRLPGHTVRVLVHLAAATRLAGDVGGGRSLLEQALGMARDTASLPLVGAMWLNLGYHDWIVGDLGTVISDIAEGLAPLRGREGSEFWQPRWLGDGVALAGLLALDRGDAGRGARLLGAAERLGFLATERYPDERARHADLVAEARQRLSPEKFAAAWAEGRAMTLEQAVTYALDEGGG